MCNANQIYRNYICGHRDESHTEGYGTFRGGDEINCCHVDDYSKCIRISDTKQTFICLDEEWSDEKGLSGTLMPYSLVYYKRGRLFLFLGYIIREWEQYEIIFCLTLIILMWRIG